MTARSRIFWVALLTAGLWWLLAPGASAYVDPGSGSFIFQILIAAGLAAGVTLKTSWRRVRDFVKSLFSRQH
ncbi:MAG: hypothetical protein ACE5KX_04005 [Acidimicrobiia bacterium]